jgi:hypothetical protein
MKLRILISVIVTMSTASYAQHVMTFTNAAKNGVSIQKLDSTYQSGINADPALSVFKDVEAYMESYKELFLALGKFLKENDFSWEKETRAFNRIYFKEDGSIDYFIYNFTPIKIDADKNQRFEELLREFVKDFKFKLSADKKFAQCSPVKYMPSKDN